MRKTLHKGLARYITNIELAKYYNRGLATTRELMRLFKCSRGHVYYQAEKYRERKRADL